MKLNRKVTDFIRLEEGNIGRRSAVVTGALLASTVLGGVLASISEAKNPSWYDECHINDHSDFSPHTDHYNGHTNTHYEDWWC